MRPACPPLVYGCKFLNFSRSKSELGPGGAEGHQGTGGRADDHLDEYADRDSDSGTPPWSTGSASDWA